MVIREKWKKFRSFSIERWMDITKTSSIRVAWANDLWYDQLHKLKLNDGTRVRDYSIFNIGYLKYPKENSPIVIRITILFLSISIGLNLDEK